MGWMRTLTRRRVLASAVALAGLAGCADSEGPGSTDTRDDTATGTDAEGAGTAKATPTAAETDTPSADELDLREANVVGVGLTPDDGAIRFEVTLQHDDDGEDGYANWWQVERLDGTRLGRRVLGHAHSRQPFTRSATIEVPDEVACVVVRGHDQTHGYGGLAMAVHLASGENQIVKQGPEKRLLDSSDCPR